MPYPASEPREVVTPRNGNGDVSDRILHQQVPSDDPRHEFTERGIRIGVCRTGDRNHRSKLRIAKCGKGARDGGKNEEQGDRGTAVEGGITDSREDSCAYDRGNSERSQIDDTQCLP